MDDIISLKNRLDSSDMFGKISALPENLLKGMELAKNANLGVLETQTFHSLVIAGMGGSAIGGEIAASYLAGEMPIPIVVQRHYQLPGFVNKRSLVICSSYSGNTEEALSAYDDGLSRGANMLAITSGGELSARAAADHVPAVIIPGGLPPRAALGYSFAALMVSLYRLGISDPPFEEIEEAALFVKNRTGRYAPEKEDNPALALARRLQDKIAVIYAAKDSLDAVASRFKCQICENAETLAFSNSFPEFNHNELVGWGRNNVIMEKFIALIITDTVEFPRIKSRCEIVGDYLREKGHEVVEITAENAPDLARIFLLIQLADFTSYYLALLDGVDPTPVVPIDILKKKLSEIK